MMEAMHILYVSDAAYINCKSCYIINNSFFLHFLQDVEFKDGHVTAGTLSGLIERLVPLPNYYPDVRFLNIIILIKNNDDFFSGSYMYNSLIISVQYTMYYY